MSNTAIQKVGQFQIDLANNSKAIKSMLPPHVDLKKFQRIAFTAVQKSPNLAGQAGLLESVIDCAKDGLMPDGKEAALVPFKGKVTYMPMVAGILKKIRQSGELKSLTANVVLEGDEFRSWTDENGPHFKHESSLLSESTNIIGAYAVAITKDGGTYFEVLKKSDIEKIRKSSSGGENGPWKTWYDEMAKKSAIRRLAKRLPMSTDIESGLETVYKDDQFYEPEEPANVTPDKKKLNSGTSPENLKEKLETKPEPKEPPVKIGDDTGKAEKIISGDSEKQKKQGNLEIF